MPRLVAIDLGGHSAKVTVLQGSGRRYTLEGRYSQPVTQDGASIPSLEARLSALDMLLFEHPEWTKGASTFAVTWPGEQTTVHRLSLPFTDRAQVERTLPFAVEAEVPFDLDEMVLGWRMTPVGGESEILVCLARRQAIGDLLAGLSSRNVNPRNVFFDADVLGHWIAGDRVAAVVDVGYSHTTVAVAKDGVVQHARTVNVGGRDFTLAVQNALGIPWAEAEAMKEGGGVSSAEAWARLPVEARTALDSPLGLLLAELRSTLIAAEDELGVEIEEVRLSGGGSRLHPLAGYLRDDLGVSIEPIVDADRDLVPEMFAEADALAARLAGQTRGVEIDLRQGKLAFRGGTDLVKNVLAYGGIAVMVFTLATVGVTAFRYHALSTELASLNERIGEIVKTNLPEAPESARSDATMAVALMKERMTDAKARAEVIDRENKVPPTVYNLKELTQAFPPPGEVTVDVSELTITPENINFSAETDGYASVARVEESLKQNSRFKEAAKGNEKKARDRVTFTVTVPLGEEGEE